MIPAEKKPWLDELLYVGFRFLWRKAFHAIYVRGEDYLFSLPPERPVLAYANHTNWWDILMVVRLTRVLTTKNFYGMMEEKQLKPYRFFSYLGAFSVDLSAPGKAAAGLRYAVKLLRDPRSLVWVFPQGQICSPHDSFTVRPGLEFLSKHTRNAMLVPMVFRYEFFRDDRPVVLIEIGKPFPAIYASPENLQAQVAILTQKLSIAIQSQDLTGFRYLEKPQLTINKRWEWVLCALRGRLKDFNPQN